MCWKCPLISWWGVEGECSGLVGNLLRLVVVNLVLHSNPLGCPLIRLYELKLKLMNSASWLLAHSLHNVFWITTKKPPGQHTWNTRLLLNQQDNNPCGRTNNYLFNCDVPALQFWLVKILDAAFSIFNSVHGDESKSTRNTCVGFKNNMTRNHLTKKRCHNLVSQRNNKSANLHEAK